MENDSEKLKVKKNIPYNLYIVIGSYLAVLAYPIFMKTLFTEAYGYESYFPLPVVIFLIIALVFSARGIKRKEPISTSGAVFFGIIVILFYLFETFSLALSDIG